MRGLAVALSMVVLAGCSTTVDGAATPAAAALKTLPTEVEITSAAGSTLSTFGFQPFVGGAEILPNGYRSDADASPIACAAVTDTAPRVVYERLSVIEAARQSYFNWDPGVASSGADTAVVRLATAEAAKEAFDAFARQWRQCDGTTVVKHVRSAVDKATETVIDAAISDVSVDGSVVSASVRTRQRPTAPTSTYERALGVANGMIVEVSLAVTPAGERLPDPRGRAMRVAQLMLTKSG